MNLKIVLVYVLCLHCIWGKTKLIVQLVVDDVDIRYSVEDLLTGENIEKWKIIKSFETDDNLLLEIDDENWKELQETDEWKYLIEFITIDGILDVNEFNKDLEMIKDDEIKKKEKRHRRFALQRNFESYTWLGIYPTLIEMLEYFKFVKVYGHYFDYEMIGKTYEDRPIYITRVGYGKHNIWMDGGIHAREWVAPPTTLYTLHKLAFSKEGQHLSKYFTFHFLPVLNPDGYAFSHDFFDYTYLKGNFAFSNTIERYIRRFWRKNRSLPKKKKINPIDGCIGTDLNRNFNYSWHRAENITICDVIYPGEKAESELEIQAMTKYMRERKNWLVYFSLHSYGCFWLIPWSNSIVRPRDYNTTIPYVNKSVTKLEQLYGTKYKIGSSMEVIYGANGTSGDWVKKELGTTHVNTLEMTPCANNKDFLSFHLPRDLALRNFDEVNVAFMSYITDLYHIIRK
ncbi:hypothetical protein SNEBB_006103 [Seison nebaliae]|nr:hypothetical protein SNEBB_006103 [Seison nebaliae]